VRWAWAEIDLGAIAHNVGVIRAAIAPAEVWAVVKADAYGHGAIDVARVALESGATGLCVALIREGIDLRRAGVTAPILLLSEQPIEFSCAIIDNGLIPTVYSRAAIEALAAAAREASSAGVDVHLKLDTGMHRVGADPADAVNLVEAVRACAELRLGAIFTHLAMADQPGAPSNARQLRRFADAVAAVRAAGHEVPRIHIANSAAALSLPTARGDLVRLGIAMYGIEPGPGVAELCRDLRPALSLHARISMVKTVRAGEGISYGLHHTFVTETVVATVPIGYADGVPRRLFATGGEVLIHGSRRPIVGVVTMDQMMIDCGDLEVSVGDEVVLLGSQSGPRGTSVIPAEEWADRLGTIGYEIVCGISKRIERISSDPAGSESTLSNRP
jgi:alanine racemase